MSEPSLYLALRESLNQEERVTQITVIGPPEKEATSLGGKIGRKILVWPDGRTLGSLGSSEADQAAAELALGDSPETGTSQTGPDEIEGPGTDKIEVFVDVFAPPSKLVIVGAVHVAIHLIHFAQRLGFRCIVVDARSVFASGERFPHADELIVGWPAEALAKMPIHDNTCCVFLTHDPKLDDPAIKVALERGAGYVGALGSRRTHAKRIEALQELGVDDQSIERIHAPIGLDLGGRKPEEIALAIAAQLLQSRYGKA